MADVEVFGSGGQLGVAVGGADHIQAQALDHATHKIQLLAALFGTAESVVQALADTLKLLSLIQNRLHALFDCVQPATNPGGGQPGLAQAFERGGNRAHLAGHAVQLGLEFAQPGLVQLGGAGELLLGQGSAAAQEAVGGGGGGNLTAYPVVHIQAQPYAGGSRRLEALRLDG